MKEKIWLKVLLVIALTMGILAFLILGITISGAFNEKVYQLEEGKVFCESQDMNYTVYFNGDKYCEDDKRLYPLKRTENDLKFIEIKSSPSNTQEKPNG